MYISDSGNAYFKNEVDHLDILNSDSSEVLVSEDEKF